MLIAVSMLIFINMFIGYRLFCETKRLWQDGEIGLLVGLKMPQVYSLIFFGLGGILVLIRNVDVCYYGVEVTTLAVLLTCAAAFFSICSYSFAFMKFRGISYRIPKLLHNNYLGRRITPFMVSIIAFDWYSRLKAILHGQYFPWLITFSEDARPEGIEFAINMLGKTTGYILLVFFVYLSVKQKKHHWRILAFIQFLLLTSQGSRGVVLLTVFITLFISQMVRHMEGYKTRIKWWIIVLLLLLPILFSVIQVARYEMQLDHSVFIDHPYKIPQTFLFSYFPKALKNLIDSSSRASYVKNQTILGRLGSYMSYAASIQQRILDKGAVMGIKGFCMSASIAFPSILYPSKPVFDSDVEVYEFYDMDTSITLDAHGTALADALAYLWFLGPLLVFLIAGAGLGLVCRYLESGFGLFGSVMILGMINLFIPTGDSFGYYLANVRNAFIFILWAVFFLKFCPSFFRSIRN